MATRKELKEAFRVGAKPTESDFSKFIDSTLFKDEDGIKKTQNGPLIIKGVGDEDLIHFYKDFDERKAQLIIRVSQRTEAEGEAKGLNFTDQNGNSLLFLDAEAKKVKAPAFEGSGAELTQLNADHIATGTVDVERIPDLNANKITDGTLAEALLPALKWDFQLVIGGDKGKFVLSEGQPDDGKGRIEGEFHSKRDGDLGLDHRIGHFKLAEAGLGAQAVGPPSSRSPQTSSAVSGRKTAPLLSSRPAG